MECSPLFSTGASVPWILQHPSASPCIHWGHPCSTGCHARIYERFFTWRIYSVGRRLALQCKRSRLAVICCCSEITLGAPKRNMNVNLSNLIISWNSELIKIHQPSAMKTHINQLLVICVNQAGEPLRRGVGQWDSEIFVHRACRSCAHRGLVHHVRWSIYISYMENTGKTWYMQSTPNKGNMDNVIEGSL